MLPRTPSPARAKPPRRRPRRPARLNVSPRKRPGPRGPRQGIPRRVPRASRAPASGAAPHLRLPEPAPHSPRGASRGYRKRRGHARTERNESGRGNSRKHSQERSQWAKVFGTRRSKVHSSAGPPLRLNVCGNKLPVPRRATEPSRSDGDPFSATRLRSDLPQSEDLRRAGPSSTIGLRVTLPLAPFSFHPRTFLHRNQRRQEPASRFLLSHWSKNSNITQQVKPLFCPTQHVPLTIS